MRATGNPLKLPFHSPLCAVPGEPSKELVSKAIHKALELEPSMRPAARDLKEMFDIPVLEPFDLRAWPHSLESNTRCKSLEFQYVLHSKLQPKDFIGICNIIRPFLIIH